MTLHWQPEYFECEFHATSCAETCTPERITHGCSISRNSITPRYVLSHHPLNIFLSTQFLPLTKTRTIWFMLEMTHTYIMIWNLRRIPADKHKISFTLMKSITYVIVQLFIARTAPIHFDWHFLPLMSRTSNKVWILTEYKLDELSMRKPKVQVTNPENDVHVLFWILMHSQSHEQTENQ